MSTELTFGLSPATLQKIRATLAQHPDIQSAVIYGSRAKGNYKPGSDIDLTLLGEGLDFDDLTAINEALEELLLPYEIDLSLFRQIDNTSLREHIERVGKVLYARDNSMNAATTGMPSA